MGVIVLVCGVVGSSVTSASHHIGSAWPILNAGLPWDQKFLDKTYMDAKDEVSWMAQETV